MGKGQPPTFEEALDAPSLHGVRQVVMIEPIWDDFVQRVYERGLHIFRIPTEDGVDDLPTYAVGVPTERLKPVIEQALEE